MGNMMVNKIRQSPKRVPKSTTINNLNLTPSYSLILLRMVAKKYIFFFQTS